MTNFNFVLRPHRLDLDILKAVSIIAVVFYHIGWLDTGYLGVDVFLAINGFLVIPPLVSKISNQSFDYWQFLLKRVMRLWPLILLATIVSLVIGYFIMLPDDYENLSQSVIASDLMSQNILSAITTRDYWDAANEYKPLMHFWYIGILIEFYLIIPIVLMLVKRCVKNSKFNFDTISVIVLCVLAISSLSLYLHPAINAGDKFYFLQYRLWEIVVGGLLGIYANHKVKQNSEANIFGWIGIIGVLVVILGSLYMPTTESDINPVSGLINHTMIIPQNLLLILVVLFTVFVLKYPVSFNKELLVTRGLGYIGKISFSIFVWHQIILAFYRYRSGNSMSLIFVVCLWIITCVLSIITYKTIEQKIKPTWRSFSICCIVLFLTCIPAGWIYINAGVVRDVQELDICRKDADATKGQFAEYCDRVYAYDQDFPVNDKVNVLVEGVSFGRDFANVLLESHQINNINLSYIFLHDEKYLERYANCDYLFTFSNKEEVPDYVWNAINSNALVYGIGPKNFGECNGVIYRNRNKVDYYDQTISILPSFYTINEEWKSQWTPEYYVDLLEISTVGHNKVKVFTDDNKFISQDCRHLTKAGAKWFANRINWLKIFK